MARYADGDTTVIDISTVNTVVVVASVTLTEKPSAAVVSDVLPSNMCWLAAVEAVWLMFGLLAHGLSSLEVVLDFDEVLRAVLDERFSFVSALKAGKFFAFFVTNDVPDFVVGAAGALVPGFGFCACVSHCLGLCVCAVHG